MGAAIGEKLRGGEVIQLISDLGGGKTALVRGLAKGLGSTDSVASPSFTISREYKAGDKTLYHFDFYRLQDPGIMANELAELFEDEQAVIAIEWADIVESIIPPSHVTIRIEPKAETERLISLSCPTDLEYVVPTVMERA
ncbi:MAG: hypothetical protein JWM37_421 [Candidatus Saccharibacteria bacterium]|nr:hypothetical protein [Candidatus Saccharibacteria bacterium]